MLSRLNGCDADVVGIIAGCVDAVCGLCFFFFQAEDGIRDLVRSRGLGDVYKRQGTQRPGLCHSPLLPGAGFLLLQRADHHRQRLRRLSLIHI